MPTLALFVGLRCVVAVLFRPGGYLPVAGRGGLSFPTWFAVAPPGGNPLPALAAQQSPVGAIVWTGILWAGAQLPAWIDPALWTVAAALTVAATVDALNLALVFGIARALGYRRPLAPVWLYASAFLPLAAAYAVTPPVETLFLLAASFLLLRRRPLAAGAVAGLSVLAGGLAVLATPAGTGQASARWRFFPTALFVGLAAASGAQAMGLHAVHLPDFRIELAMFVLGIAAIGPLCLLPSVPSKRAAVGLAAGAVALAGAFLRPFDPWALAPLVPLVCLVRPDPAGAAMVAGLGALAASQAWLFPDAGPALLLALRAAAGAGTAALALDSRARKDPA